VIVKSNGWPTYNFASPIDDHLMEITHVFRGEEHLPNAPLQLMFADALGLPRPEALVHFPVIVGRDGKKLSKRLHPEVRLDLYREQGYLPEALRNYLALLGWNPGSEKELFTLDELIEAFDIGRVQKANAMFDWDKLDWLNGTYIRSLSDDDLAERLRPFLPDLPLATLRAAAPALKERLQRLDRAPELLGYLMKPPPPPELKNGQREMLEAALEDVREANGWSRGRFFTPIREAVAGRVSPPLFDTLALLSKTEALGRMRRVLT
jgi:glutamyl/glutaminyl-tRNA synthetase